MEVAENNQVAVMEKSFEIFQTAPAILFNHQVRAEKALSVAESIMAQWTLAFAIADTDARMSALSVADERSMKFLANCTKASEEMRDARKAITQLMDMMKTMYTTEENSLDPKKGPKPQAIQQNRNAYATEVLKDQERKRKAAEHKAAKEREANEMRSFINKTITQKLLDFLAEKKVKVTDSFNAITLADFDKKSEQLAKMNIEFPKEKIGLIILYSLPFSYRHDDIELLAIKTKEHENYDFDAFYAKYSSEVSELKQSLIDRLPSKKSELVGAKLIAEKAEQDRKDELERQRLAQVQRDKEMAEAGEKRRKELEEKNRIAKEQEAQRMADLQKKAEQDRLDQEAAKQHREREEKQRLAEEAEQAKLKAEQQAEMDKSAADAMTLFNQTAETSEAGASVPEVRQKTVITVTHQAGWVELFQFWYQRAGCKMGLDDMEKMTFAKLKAFAEKEAQDTPKKKGERIESKLLTYGQDVSAVNRKTKSA